jgi:peptide subunit release factor 1 (eRF1)
MTIDLTPSATHPDVLDIPQMLATLRETPPPTSGVLSTYLATPRLSVDGRTYLASFHRGCEALRASLAPEAVTGFEQAVARADAHLAADFVPRQPGLALFVGSEPGYVHAVPLPNAPIEQIAWGPHPALAALEAVLDDNERISVALFHMGGARLFSIYLGAIEESQEITSDVPGQHATGRWGGVVRTNDTRQSGRGMGRGPRGGGMAAARYARHHRDALHEHARDTAHALMDLLRRRPFDRLLLAGPPEPVSVLRDELPRPLRARLAGQLSLAATAGDADVLQAAIAAAESIERETETRMVDELLAAATTPRVALSCAATTAALSEGRVRHLFIADSFAVIGGECRTCGRVVAGFRDCPICNAPTSQLGDLREYVVRRAVEQGARIETVSGDAAALLSVYDGLGAWTRY